MPMYCNAWKRKSKSVKIKHLDVTKSLICSKALMTAQTSAVNIDAESGNLTEIMVSDGKKLQHTLQNSHPVNIFINKNVTMVPVLYFHKKH